MEINSKNLHESYILHIRHISCTKGLCLASLILPGMGFPNSGKIWDWRVERGGGGGGGGGGGKEL